MKLILTQQEIEIAIKNHVLANVAISNGSSLTIDFSATRGADGLTATIDIPYMGVTQLNLDAVPATDPVAKPTPSKRPSFVKAAEPEATTEGLAADAPVALLAEASDNPAAEEAATDAIPPASTGGGGLFEN